LDSEREREIIQKKRRVRMTKSLNKRICRSVGVQGNLKEITIGHYSGAPAEVWTWKAEEGKVMDWSKKVGWKWNLPHRPRTNKKRLLDVCHRLDMEEGGFVVKDYTCERHNHTKCPLAFLDWDSVEDGESETHSGDGNDDENDGESDENDNGGEDDLGDGCASGEGESQ
jgi:hypothetical protein